MEKLENAVKAGNDGLSLEFDLPREAYWEYACRAGTVGTFSDRNTIVPPGTTEVALKPTLGLIAWYLSNNNTVDGPHTGVKEVGLRKANPAGLYDVHGNVYELCLDAWDLSTTLMGGNNPLSTSGSYRAVRGGSYSTVASPCRSAYRDYDTPMPTNTNIGFRLCTVGGGNVVP